MRRLTLIEHATTECVALDEGQFRALRRLAPSVGISPSIAGSGFYDLSPGSWVGAICLQDLAIEIRPKTRIDRLLFMLSYCLRPGQWSAQDFDFSSADSLVEAFIPPFLTQVGRAFRSGILQGYRTDDAALPGVRGRIRFDDQIRDRFGLFPPVEVRFDEFSEDIEVNRLIRAALCRLERLAVRYPTSRQKLRFFQRSLERVAEVEYMPSALPEVVYNRLNEHYRPAVELAKLVLRWTTFDLGHGDVPATAFLVDMNRVFEDFVVVALRESLAVPAGVFSQGASGRRLFLDSPELIRLEPDMSWWENDVCTFVGDAKYKRVDVAGIKHPDLYQLLAYAEAANLPTGLLIYAAGEGDPACHIVRHSGVKLYVASLDLCGSPEEILKQIDQMARGVRSLRESNRGHLAAAWPGGPGEAERLGGD